MACSHISIFSNGSTTTPAIDGRAEYLVQILESHKPIVSASSNWFPIIPGAAARALARKLPSTIAAREFVQKTPIPRVLDRQIGLVVARSTKLWLGEHDAEGESLIIYKGGECRAAFQTKGTRGGRLLRDLLRAG